MSCQSVCGFGASWFRPCSIGSKKKMSKNGRVRASGMHALCDSDSSFFLSATGNKRERNFPDIDETKTTSWVSGTAHTHTQSSSSVSFSWSSRERASAHKRIRAGNKKETRGRVRVHTYIHTYRHTRAPVTQEKGPIRYPGKR
nr:hypothetical protein [Pandoravirus massiliensis]